MEALLCGSLRCYPLALPLLCVVCVGSRGGYNGDAIILVVHELFLLFVDTPGPNFFQLSRMCGTVVWARA